MEDMDRKKLQRALKNKDFVEAKRLLENSLPFTADESRYVVETVIQTGCLVVLSGMAYDLSALNAFQTALAESIVRFGSLSARRRFSDHLSHVVLIREAYENILDLLDESLISQYTPAEQIWAAINRTAETSVEVSIRLMRTIQEGGSGLEGFSFRIPASDEPDEDPSLVDPDAVMNMLAGSLFATLQMFSHREKWFRDGILVVPRPVKINDDLIFRSGANTLLASTWSAIENAEQHLRFFGGSVTLEPFVNIEGKGQQGFVTRFILNFEHKLYELIAHHRLSQICLGFALETVHIGREKVSSRFVPTRLAPQEFVSNDEIVAYKLLRDVYHLPVSNDGERYGELSIRKWLRGYAVLKEWYGSDKSSGLDLSPVQLRRVEIAQALELAGLRKEEANYFSREATLSKGKRDLFDAPLLEDEEGNLHLLRSVLHSSGLWMIVASQIGPFSKSSTKGTGFEKSVTRLFREANIPARGSVKYKENGTEYECDVVVLWSGHLFVIECKNHVLPGSSPEHSFRFWQMLDEEFNQCKRIADQISKRSDLLAELFGTDAVVEKVHPILLNAMPFCIPGQTNEVFIYDYSALNRFFTNPFLAFQIPVTLKDGSKILTEHRVQGLWSSDRPCPEDLIREMNSPVQFAGQHGSWYIQRDLCPVSEQLRIEIPSLQSKDVSLDDVLKSRGIDAEAISLVRNLSKSLVTELESE